MRNWTATIGLAAICLTGAVTQAQQGSGALTPLDYIQIEQLYVRYADALDSGDGNALAQLFTPDGVLNDEDGKVREGRTALVERARENTDRTARHYVWNMRIEPSAEGATGKAYGMLGRLNAVGQPPTLVANGQYWDSFVKTADGWRIKKREFRRPPAPANQAPAGQPAGRGRGGQ